MIHVARPDFPTADRSTFADPDIKAAAKGIYLVRDYDPERLEGAEVPLPEYPTCRDKSKPIAAHLLRWLKNEGQQRRVVDWLHALSEEHAIPGATQRAAEYIIEVLGQESSGARPEAA